ncbi:MAG: ABC transporter substrate-binding protein [Campylobacterales bacterium]
MMRLLLLFSFVLLPVLAKPFVDDTGRRVEIPDTPKSVIGLSPPVTYMIHLIAPDLLSGVNFNPKKGSNLGEERFLGERFLNLPIVGGSQGLINQEALLSARPDLIISWRKDAVTDPIETLMSKNGVPVLYVDLYAFADYPAVFLKMGEALGRNDRAKQLHNDAQRRMNEVAAVVALIPQNQRPVVYYAQGVDGLLSECTGSMHYEAIAFAGGINPHRCTITRGKGMEPVNIEQVIAYNPQIIVAQEPEFMKKVYTDPRWQMIDAVKSKRVYYVPKRPFNWIDRPPSFMRLLGVRYLAGLFFPDRFQRPFEEEMVDFYQLYFGVKLDRAEIDRILRP